MKIVKDLFLRCMSSVYLFAFASLYVQIPGQFYTRHAVANSPNYAFTALLPKNTSDSSLSADTIPFFL